MEDLQKQQLFGNSLLTVKCDPVYGESVRNALSHGMAKAANPNSGGE